MANRQLSDGAVSNVVGDTSGEDVHEVADGPLGDVQAIRDGRGRVRGGGRGRGGRVVDLLEDARW